MAEIARLIRYDELDKLLELYEVLHPEDPSVRADPSLKPLWDEIYANPGLFYIVVEADGEIVSSCTLAVVKNLTRGLRPYGVVENVITRPDQRKKGYATMALHKAIEIARGQGCYKVMLLSGARDEATLRFYEHAGFARGVKTGFIVDLK